ncbi:hypothetical protein BDV95DRAFT_629139 [Massariosphaeria phaeospora]|uniref:U6 small nuclear RNA (adenine-(43)-N(6))-methyltransferase n=1 Tax=Massariosphaeria phaeospora TaxID=100035 RepID=A0A7C8MDC0_9PLEO|nr:hypothetical protein BDV95DRAFT_629139 [Massariosphaeria phaeospora]
MTEPPDTSADLAQLPPYEHVDFQALADNDEEFNKVWKKCAGHLDFQDPDCVRALTKAGLKVDFGLDIDLPADRLCPPVPNRFNYVAWIQKLLDCTSADYSDEYDPSRKVVGLDIGTGASAIYTLLCLKPRPNWTMCATDVDKKSFDCATRNLAINNMLPRTRILRTMETNSLIPLKALAVDKLDFTICNPPFFADEQDMRSSLKGEGKSWSPNSVCTGAEVEMVCEGGDVGFVTRIVNESLELREKVTWYSSMLGKLSSVKAIVHLLKKHDINNWAVGSIDVGGATKRWTVAWSFGDYRPKHSIARIELIANEYLPFPTGYEIPLGADHTPVAARKTIDNQLSALDLHWTWNAETSTGIGIAAQNVWKRAYRREFERRKKDAATAEHKAKSPDDDDDDAMQIASPEPPASVALAFRIHVYGTTKGSVAIDWLRGTDQVLWESFCGMIHRSFRKG